MDRLLSVTFEAHHSGQNHHRWYEVVVGRDLLEDWTLTIRYGRVGSAPQIRQYAATQPEALRTLIRERLLRRLSAPKRIGCAYRLTSFDAVPNLDKAFWLPEDIMGKFRT